jgi:hypothetical protein
MEAMRCSEASARNCHYWLRNNPEERISKEATTLAFHLVQFIAGRWQLRVNVKGKGKALP